LKKWNAAAISLQMTKVVCFSAYDFEAALETKLYPFFGVLIFLFSVFTTLFFALLG